MIDHDTTEQELNTLAGFMVPRRDLPFRLARAAIGGALLGIGLTYRDKLNAELGLEEEPCCEGCAKGTGCEGCGGAKVLRRPRRPPRPRGGHRPDVPETPRQRARRRPSPQDMPPDWHTARPEDRRLVAIERTINELAGGIARVEDRMVEAHVQHALHVAGEQLARHIERFWSRHKDQLAMLKEQRHDVKPEDDLTLLEVLTHEVRELDWWDHELYERTLVPLLDPAEPEQPESEAGNGSQIVS